VLCNGELNEEIKYTARGIK